MMPIFRQLQELVQEEKTETRRELGRKVLDTAGDVDRLLACAPVNGSAPRVLYEVGKDYPVIPKRGAKRLMIYQVAPGQPILSTDHRVDIGCTHIDFYTNIDKGSWLNAMKINGWLEVRVQVLALRVEWLHDITEDGAKAEGVKAEWEDLSDDPAHPDMKLTYRAGYRKIWEEINGAGSWSRNPLVAVIRFKVIYR